MKFASNNNTKEYHTLKMERTTFVFIAFALLLVLGIFIMMKPHVFTFTYQLGENFNDPQSVKEIVPRFVIMLGSLLVIAGLVGLSILGFKLFKDLMAETNSEAS